MFHYVPGCLVTVYCPTLVHGCIDHTSKDLEHIQNILPCMSHLVLLASVHCRVVGNGPFELWGNISVQPLCAITVAASNPSVDIFLSSTHVDGLVYVLVRMDLSSRIFYNNLHVFYNTVWCRPMQLLDSQFGYLA